jgi:DNA polymerase-3 subunit delta
MAATVHALDYLAAPEQHPPQAVCVLYGDEGFLQQMALRQLRRSLADASGDDLPFGSFEGATASWREVADELSTVAMFGGQRRLAVVREADAFIRNYRTRLEQRLEAPKPAGVLTLVATAWPSNTRLYEAVGQRGLAIECRPPEKQSGKHRVLDEGRLRKWLASWAEARHGVQLRADAGQLLLELAGPVFGLLDQELAKLALFTEPGGQITRQMVCEVVGGWRTKTIWQLLDAAADGDASEALKQLDRLLYAGANPVALFGQISWSLRRFAAATRAVERQELEGHPPDLPSALKEAGFRAWPKQALATAERQLRQLGRHRAGRFYCWLLDADLALKGAHSSPHRARLVLERLIVRMSRELGPRRGRSSSSGSPRR